MHIWDQPLPEPLSEDYQHPTDTYAGKLTSEQSNMKLVKDEMSRGLEKYARAREASNVPETAAPQKEERASSEHKTRATFENALVPGKVCENPDCVCFVGYEPSCHMHSSSL